MILNGQKKDFMKTHELLDRLELLYPDNEMLQDLRRAFVDDDEQFAKNYRQY